MYACLFFRDVAFSTIDLFTSKIFVSLFVEVLAGLLVHHVEVFFVDQHGLEVLPVVPGLDAPPFPGPKGQEVFENISAEAWNTWQDLQTMLINEKHLNMMDKDARKYLNQQRDRFLAGEDVDQAEGFIPEEK